MNRHDQRGSITAFVAVVASALVMVAGMAYDGGQVIAAHNAARNEADRAARAGAQQIDIDHLRATNEARLDPAAAESAAIRYLHQVGATGTATASAASITVTVTRTQPLLILPGGDRTITVSGTANAVDQAQP